MIKPFRLFLLCATLAVAALCVTELMNRFDPDPWVLPRDPVNEARSLADQQRWAEVRLLTDFVRANPRLGDERAAAGLARRADRELNTFQGRLRSFARGAASGEPSDTASMLGSLSLDLFVIGDIRDLAVQGWKQIHSGDGDVVILALSAIGVTTTFAPQFDWAPALLKALKRSGALTRKFLASLKDASRTAVKTGNFQRLGGMVSDVGRATRHLGPGPLRGAMRSVNSAGDITRVARAGRTDAAGTYAIARLFGNAGVKRISRDGRNVGVLVTSMKTGSRLGKIASKAMGTLPSSWLALVLALVLALAVLIAAPAFRRPAGRRATPRAAKHPHIEPVLQPAAASAARRINR